jgi:DNA processing protein
VNKEDEFSEFPLYSLSKEQLPRELIEIVDSPKELYMRGVFPRDLFYITIVGSRMPTPYGRQACEHIIRGLAGYPVVICSGLAIGIDTIAHRAALEVGIPTVAVPGSGLAKKVIYPRQNVQLAYDILRAGGALASEFKPHEESRPYFFPKRNRIMAALSSFVCVIEAKEKSGSLITARLALDYNKHVGAVPGPIFSEISEGTNKLITEGALPIGGARDILEALSLAAPAQEEDIEQTAEEISTLSLLHPEEAVILQALDTPLLFDELVRRLRTPAHQLNITLSSLEMRGVIKNEYGMIKRLLIAKQKKI